MTDVPYAKWVARHQRMLIARECLPAEGGRTSPVITPATGERLAEVPYAGAAEAGRAIESAQKAFPGWAERPAAERAGLLQRAADRLLADRERLARLLTAEAGKPIAQGRGGD